MFFDTRIHSVGQQDGLCGMNGLQAFRRQAQQREVRQHMERERGIIDQFILVGAGINAPRVESLSAHLPDSRSVRVAHVRPAAASERANTQPEGGEVGSEVGCPEQGMRWEIGWQRDGARNDRRRRGILSPTGPRGFLPKGALFWCLWRPGVELFDGEGSEHQHGNGAIWIGIIFFLIAQEPGRTPARDRLTRNGLAFGRIPFAQFRNHPACGKRSIGECLSRQGIRLFIGWMKPLIQSCPGRSRCFSARHRGGKEGDRAFAFLRQQCLVDHRLRERGKRRQEWERVKSHRGLLHHDGSLLSRPIDGDRHLCRYIREGDECSISLPKYTKEERPKARFL